jgi:tRNA(Ile)-lysidine synthase
LPKKVKNKGFAPEALTEELLDHLKTHTKPGAFFLLALSGGVDSMVLLHALHALKEYYPFKLHALHVHHGLSAFADGWANHCQEACDALSVPLKVVRVNVKRNSKSGIEAAARAARYAALLNYRDADHVQPDFVVTAHHEQDQAETLLLQLSRGAGVKGLAGMALLDEKKRIYRPLLNTSKAKIQAYANTQGLRWCEDDSNLNVAFERNFLRNQIMPAWSQRHSALHQNLARSARHLAEASQLLDELAAMDAEALLDGNSLCLAGLRKLSLPRAKNCLRWWLGGVGVLMPNAEYLDEILLQLLTARQDAHVDLKLQAHSLKRFQQRAFLVKNIQQEAFNIAWHGEEKILLPSGVLHISCKAGNDDFLSPQMIVRSRRGGESLKINKNRPSRTLKYLMQEASIPPWLRTYWPLIFIDDVLVCVPNIGVADHAQEAFEKNKLRFEFQPN